MKKQVFQQVDRTVVDEDGVVKSDTSVTGSWVDREPDYFKVYIKDLLRIRDIPKASMEILFCILSRMSYSTNQIVLVSGIKRQIAEELNISTETVGRAIDLFYEKSIILRQERAIYVVNPYFFGKGKWKELHTIRLTVEYSKKGKMILKTDFSKHEEEVLSTNEN